ncbi:MAG: sodium:proton antiporter, partial [Alphaproteobacteria bacterium]
GVTLELLDERARDLVLGASLITIFANPALYTFAQYVRRRAAPPAALEEPLEEPIKPAPDDGLVPSKLQDHAVLVGYGRVGQLVAEHLIDKDWPLLVIEDA